MGERLKHMLIKEFIQIARDPRMRAILLVIPVVQVLIFGYAVTTDVRNIRTAVYDLDGTPASRELLSRFEGSGYFECVARIRRESEVADLLDRGEVKAVLRMNRGFGRDLGAGRTAHVQILVDGTDSNTASVILSYAARITGDFGAEMLSERASRTTGRTAASSAVSLASRAWFNPNLESRNFYVPGVIALLVMVLSILLSSMAVVREKEIGTIEQIMVTPMGRAEFILGKTVPFVLISLFDVVLISGVAVFWFDVPIAGNPLILLASTVFYLMGTLGVGLFISTVSRTQQQAMMTAFFFMQPAILLSGFIYPIANMPEAVQWLTLLNPLRYFLVILRGVFLKGVGLDVLWPQMAALAVLGASLLALASQRFKKTLA
ncbi:MAG: ABC transporter permease [Acidobacteriota bacterium]